MIRATFIALTLAAPVSAATIHYNDDLLLIVGEDGRPVFRPIDGVETWGGKYATPRPKRRPCEPLPGCLEAPSQLAEAGWTEPVSNSLWEALIPAPEYTSVFAPSDYSPRPTFELGGGGTSLHPRSKSDPPALPAIPLPPTGWLLLSALVGLTQTSRILNPTKKG